EETSVSESDDLGLRTRLLELLPGVTFCTHMDLATGQTRWLYISSRASELFDVPEAEFIDNPNALVEIVVPEDRAAADAARQRSFQTGEPFRSTGRVKRRNGEIRWMETHAVVERRADGSVRMFGQITDITARREVEQALAESEAAKARSEALYRQTVDALPVG